MSEIIWGIDLGTSTTNCTPVKRYCRSLNDMCELATDFSYCKLTSCFKKSYSTQCIQNEYRYGMCIKTNFEIEKE